MKADEQLNKTVPVQAEWDLLLRFMACNNYVLRLHSDGSGRICQPSKFVYEEGFAGHGFTAIKYLINDIKAGRI